MRGEHKPMQGEMRGKMGAMPSEPLTDAQRAELTKKFDQRLAQHQANQNAMAQACQGQKAGTTIQLKMGEQTINGKCEVRFQLRLIHSISACRTRCSRTHGLFRLHGRLLRTCPSVCTPR